MRKAAIRHPIAASLAVTVIFVAAMLLGSLLLYYAPPFFLLNGAFLQQFVAETVICLVGIALIAIFGYGHIWNQTEKFGKGLICGGYILIISVISAISGLSYEISTRGPDFARYLEPGWKLVVFLLTAFLIGLGEESFFRGVIANLFWDKHAKDPAGVWTATIYSGLIFGLMHVINLLSSEPVGVMVQMTGVIAMGMAFTAIYYRTKNLWVTIFLHAFLDFCALLPTALFGGSIDSEISSYTPVTAITSSVPYIIVTMVLLRKKKMVEMLAADESAIGMIPSPDGQLVMSVEIKSSPESRSSRAKAVVIALVIGLSLFFGCVALSGGFGESFESVLDSMLSEEVLNSTHAGQWNGDAAFGQQTMFEVPESRDYTVTLKSLPTSSQAYVFVQIKQGDDVIYEANYGGKCSDVFGLYLEAGEYYELNLVYDYSKVSDPAAEYNTTVTIK